MVSAAYPTSVVSFGSDRQDLVSPVMAIDVNQAYAEIKAIETILGTYPNVADWSGTFDGVTTSFLTVGDRIKNLEAGIKSSVLTSGESVIQPSVSSNRGLVIKAASGQTASLLEFQTSSGTVVTSINKDGYIATIDGGTA